MAFQRSPRPRDPGTLKGQSKGEGKMSSAYGSLPSDNPRSKKDTPATNSERPDRQKKMFDVCRDALVAVQSAIRPGNTFGEAFEAHARILDTAGMQKHRLNACGYSLGTTFSPIWMDRPMLYHGNRTEFEPNMVIFCHMIIFDSDANLAMTLGETIHVNESGFDRLSRSPWELVEN